MSAIQTWILRSSIVFGMIVAVVTVLYFTPMPEHHFKSCDRPCHELDWPMICRIKLTLEVFHTLGKSCEECPLNASNCSNKHCILADGKKRSLLAVNKKLPAPSIQVCQNDIVVVDVTNKVPGQEFTIHWRGQDMQATPCMDGVPMVTQCPISSFTTFQYKFRASSPGTHLYHSHSSAHMGDGIYGAIVVRQADLMDPQKRLYDVDSKEYLMVVSEWNRRSTFNKIEAKPALLINGKGNIKGKISEFVVRSGLRYRFRMAYASGAGGCPIELMIQDHRMKVIALDGHSSVPYEVTSVVLGRGERLDFVLKANKRSNRYEILVKSKCSDVTQVTAVLRYEEVDDSLDADNNLVEDLKFVDLYSENPRVFETNICESLLGKVCLNNAQSLLVMPSALRTEKVESKFYFLFDHLIMDSYDSNNQSHRIPRVNNITFTFPSSPLLSQQEDVAPETICNSENIPKKCHHSRHCECVHVEQIPLDSSVEIVLVDRGNEEENIFHIHGHSFYVTATRQFETPVTLEEVKSLDNNGLLFKRNLKSPAHKDTIRIPKFGAVAIRFIANNPGFWLMRDEHANHWTRGMDVILQVGQRRDFQTIPFDFPRCGNWIGPEFFLV